VGVISPEGDDLPTGGPKQRLVLALLLASPGRVVPADRLAEALWPTDPPADPRRSLQVHISNLRRTMDGLPVAHHDDGYRLQVDPGQVDANRFADLVEEGAAQLPDDPGGAAATLREALGMWRGRPFGSLADEPALAAEVARLEELHRRGLDLRIDADLARGLAAELVGELRDLTRRLPLRERYWERLMVALYRAGRQADALAAYEQARDILAEELGIDPSTSLQELHERVLRQSLELDLPGDLNIVSRKVTPPSAASGAASRSVRSYELIEEVGSGGFGVVYRGRQPGIDRDVAIKVIRPELANDPRFVRRFEVEAQTIARLEHLRIVPLYDYWREPSAAYLVMRWLRGGSLAQALRRGPWRLEAAVDLIAQVASALDVAHRHGIAHLDVKPANVLLDEDDNAYLSDFGIARGVDDPPVSPGSAPYLTPEHVTQASLTPATDIFGLGLLAFELLTGSHPYEGETAATLPRRVLQQPLPGGTSDSLPAHVWEALVRATAVDPAERFDRVVDFAAALQAGMQDEKPAIPGTVPIRNPYKGLQAFQESDAEDFHGRERLVRHLVDRLGQKGASGRFTAVVGPSGSGKSSLVRAGLVPAVRRGEIARSDQWFVTTMVPGTTPVAELAWALIDVAIGDAGDVRGALADGDDGLVRAVDLALPAGSQLLLIIDQFEELFSAVRALDRDAFSRLLHHAVTEAQSPVKVIVTLRADFFDHPLLDARLGALVADHTVPVATLSVEELERAIVAPARAVGVHVDRDLVSQIISDVIRAPGALPLLQYTLTELFSRRRGDRLTLDDYRAIGGVQGALAGRAEALYTSLDPAAQALCRQVFLRMVTIGELGTGTRRRVTREDLGGLAGTDALEEVLETFGRHRLLTFDREPSTRVPTVEVAHEALLHAWDRLHEWIEAARDDLRMHRRLEAAVGEWRAAERSDGYLLDGLRLSAFEEWAERSPLSLTAEERELLVASREAAARREGRELARQQREEQLAERSTSRLRALVAVSLVAAVVATGLALVAFGLRGQALQNERIATARGLASAAIAELDVDPERSILLAIEAVGSTRDVDGSVLPEAESALRQALMASRIEQRIPGGGQVRVAPDGRVAIVAADGMLSVWDPASQEPSLELDDHWLQPTTRDERWIWLHDRFDVSPDGTALVAATSELQGVIRDAVTGDVQVRLDGNMYGPRFSRDGALVVGLIPAESPSGWLAARSVGVWDAATGDLLQRIDAPDVLLSLALSPDGSWIVAVSEVGGTRAWDVPSGDVRWHAPKTDDMSVYSVATHPDGDRMFLGGRDGSILVRDAETGELLTVMAGHTTLVNDLHVSADGTRVLSASNLSARVWDSQTGEQLVVLRGHGNRITSAAFHPDGVRVVTTSAEDATTRIWDASVPGGAELAAHPGPDMTALWAANFSPDGRHIAIAGPGATVHVRDVATGAHAIALQAGHPVRGVTYSADGTTIAAGALTGVGEASPDQWQEDIYVWDVVSGARRNVFTGLSYPVWDLALNEDGSLVAIATHAGQLHVMDVDDGTEVFTYDHDPGPVYRVAYEANGRHIVVGGQEAALVLNAATGHVLRELDVESSVIDVAFLDDGRVLTAEVAGHIRMWDVQTGQMIDTIAEHVGQSVAVFGDALGYIDGDSVVVRDLATGVRRFSIRYGADPVRVRFSPDGRHLATVVSGGPTHLHVVDVADLLDLASARVTRPLTEQECLAFLGTSC
jgi:serine/threonine protein kinase/WD40 repeat protein/DNA-binding SARP family transcriptional activator